MALAHRTATAADHPAFARLFLELATGDPIPTPEVYARDIAPQTWLFEQDGALAGYLWFQRLDGVGYVRHVVVDPALRGRGLGREMMLAVAADLRAAGCARWCLNVKPDNVPAIGLYEALGMRETYRSAALRFPWTLVDDLPPPDRSLGTCPIDPADDAALEAAFHLPSGQIAAARARPRIVLQRLHDPAAPDQRALGFASFDPDFPGAFPFRVAAPAYAQPLLAGLRARAEKPDMGIVAEADPRLVDLLVGHGAVVRLVILHLEGDIPSAQ